MSRRLSGLSAVVVLAAAAVGDAHFHVLLPAEYGQWSGAKGRPVAMRILWGHGFEHAWMDAEPPVELYLVAPDGMRTDLRSALKPAQIPAADGKTYKAFAFTVEPASRGDYVFALQSPLIWDETDESFLQDYAKCFLHVEDKGGWDRKLGQKFELVPLMRPYALQRGSVMRALVLYDGKPLRTAWSNWRSFSRGSSRRPICPARNSLRSRPRRMTPALWRSAARRRVVRTDGGA